jgi:hypothetical protein
MKIKLAHYLFFTLTLVSGVILTSRAQEQTGINSDSLSKTIQNINEELSKLKRLRITGYIQPQYQYIDSAGAPSAAGGDFIGNSSPYFSRFTMRRGRLKFTYEYKNAIFVLQPDFTEKGIFMRETYVTVRDPWANVVSLTAGCLQVPFGWEIIYSSRLRESPERARMIQNLFPVERDLGAFLSIQAPKNSVIAGLKLDLGVMNGSAGIAGEFDNNKDYSSRIQYSKASSNEKIQFSVGGSFYTGGYKLGSVKDFEMGTASNGNPGFVYSSDTANHNRIGERIYYGCDFQTTIDWIAGTTIIRGEFIMGTQPGSSSGTRSLGAPPTSNIYQREFNGAYFYLVQNIAQTKFQIVLKYDWYDPNLKVSGKEIGAASSNTKTGDIRFDTYGAGLTYKINSNVKIFAYYDYVINENTLHPGYVRDIKDNVTTIRMQFAF